MTKKLIVKLRRDGSIDAETAGMHGAECMDYIAALENLLEAETVSSTFTDDYSRISTDTENEQRGWDRT